MKKVLSEGSLTIDEEMQAKPSQPFLKSTGKL